MQMFENDINCSEFTAAKESANILQSYWQNSTPHFLRHDIEQQDRCTVTEVCFSWIRAYSVDYNSAAAPDVSCRLEIDRCSSLSCLIHCGRCSATKTASVVAYVAYVTASLAYLHLAYVLCYLSLFLRLHARVLVDFYRATHWKIQISSAAISILCACLTWLITLALSTISPYSVSYAWLMNTASPSSPVSDNLSWVDEQSVWILPSYVFFSLLLDDRAYIRIEMCKDPYMAEFTIPYHLCFSSSFEVHAHKHVVAKRLHCLCI